VFHILIVIAALDVNVSIRVHAVSDAGIGSGIHVSSVGIGRRKKHVTFNICVESLL
jgi:hypothetical protein